MMEVVQNVPESKEVRQDGEKVARNKVQMLLKRAKPIGIHLATNVAANVAVVKVSGGDLLLPAAAVVEHQMGITQSVQELFASTMSYTAAHSCLGSACFGRRGCAGSCIDRIGRNRNTVRLTRFKLAMAMSLTDLEGNDRFYHP